MRRMGMTKDSRAWSAWSESAMMAGILLAAVPGCSYGWTIGEPTSGNVDGGATPSPTDGAVATTDAPSHECEQLLLGVMSSLVLARKCSGEATTCVTEPDKCGCTVFVGNDKSGLDAFR